MSWEEWDGNGFDEAFAWSLGTWRDLDEAAKKLRWLGVETPEGKTTELVYGFVGHVEGEIVYDVCNAMGVTWDDDNVWVDPESIRPATFAIFVDRE
jgi:hypothetical protein